MADFINVTSLNRLAKQVLAQCEPLNDLIVCGEISGFTLHYKSGHLYFTLKDETASVKAVMFRSQTRLLNFEPQNGMQVLAYGHATIYERDGKRPLPAVPRCIGVVTSKTGAAWQDVQNVIGRRWPMTRLLLAPVTVQGLEAEQSIIAGIRALDRDPRPDLILVTRGGGSKEDLWIFNSERIARAAAGCRKPVVSAVGHEIDTTILDYVADLRAPTPSAAAELCVPDRGEILQKIAVLQENIQKNIQNRLQVCYNKFTMAAIEQGRQSQRRMLERRERELTQTVQAVRQAQRHRTGAAQAALESAGWRAGMRWPHRAKMWCRWKNFGRGSSLCCAARRQKPTAPCSRYGKRNREGMAMKQPKSFEEGLQRLQELLAVLQDDTTPLSQSVKVYAEAAGLISYCKQTLDDAKLKIDEIDAELEKQAGENS